MAKVRLVLDTNVCVSGLLWTGTPHLLIRAAEAGDLVPVTTPTESLLSVVEVVQEPRIEPVIAQDPDDDKFLACAVASRAPWIVSGDAHLLTVRRYRGIPIVTPKQFWDRWAKRSK